MNTAQRLAKARNRRARAKEAKPKMATSIQKHQAQLQKGAGQAKSLLAMFEILGRDLRLAAQVTSGQELVQTTRMLNQARVDLLKGNDHLTNALSAWAQADSELREAWNLARLEYSKAQSKW